MTDIKPMQKQQKILIVDDDNRNIFALQAVLKAKGFECVTATSAEKGIASLKEDKNIAIVLMDMMMPDMDGYEAIHKIKTDGTIATIPVIAVTAQAMDGDKEKCLKAGASAYISKPIDVDELMFVLEQC